MKYNIIKIEMKNFKSVESIDKLFLENDIEGFSAKKIFEMKDSADVFFLDLENKNIFAYIPKGKKEIKYLFFEDLKSLTCLSKELKEIEKDSLSLNFILEKISKSGMNSLSIVEKEFLKNESKK